MALTQLLKQSILGGTAVAALAFVSTVDAAPYYVGANPTPENTLFLSFKDAPIKERGPLSEGNVAAIELQADKAIAPNLAASLNLPVYMASSDATGTGSSTNLGNISAKLNWNNVLTPSTAAFRWGYFAELDGYVPTDRNSRSSIVAASNPTVDYYRYLPFSSALHPKVGLMGSQDFFSVKGNLGYAYNYIGRDSFAAGDNHRNAMTAQLGGSYHPLPKLNLNLEYNTIYLDTKSAGGRGRYRHGIAPSVSGDIGPVTAAFSATFPIDAPTRDLTIVALGLNAGVNF